ncbi:DJ-1 family glyoxalase III [Celerinatantimonas sp. MCCC 1A17872]|uniref:DJ-1 family glyoxalase III n=1 Tax=Celerinatantimonas sp. MCCC 1A17872 TaxID=3177514 RepID=UPI0038C13CA8
MVNVMVALAPGSEEIETVCLVDTLRRGEFIVDLVSVGDELEITCSRGVTLIADKLLADVSVDDYQLLVLPGGAGGSEFMRNTPDFIEFIKEFYQPPKYLAAICAAPALVLNSHQICPQATITCHPDFFSDLNEKYRSEQRVVVDNKHRVITSRGPGTAIELALELLAQFGSEELARQIAEPMLLKG